ncbi:acyl-CoA thioesterase [Nocardioides sp.]|uniref:acyl-CoA thioesterase n=1 Tax=Nocardioides sp. TaxID=35761 RepID=UPI0035B432C8
MPRSVAELVNLLDLEVIEDNLFRGRQPDTDVQRVFGGQVAAHALVAATRTAPPGFDVHSFHAYFLRPGDPSVPIVYDVETLRSGRSFATRRVLARQHGRPIFVTAANFQVPEGGYEHHELLPEGVPEPEACPALVHGPPDPDAVSAAITRAWEREWAAFDVRDAGSSAPGGGLADREVPARSRLWIRVNGRLPDDQLQHLAAFTYASDMPLLAATMLPHGPFLGNTNLQAASLDHTIWFHRRFRADEWWLYDQRSPSASGGRGLAFARVFTADGRLVASVAQEGLIRPHASTAFDGANPA